MDDEITACVKQIYLLGVICKVSNRKTLSGETFCFLNEYLNIVFLRAPGWPTTNFLGTYCYFPVIRFVHVAPVTVVAL